LAEVVYGLEPTASYHKPLAEYLIRQGEHVVYVSNVAVARNRELLDGRWDKNDKKDAANVADLVGQGRCLYYDVPEKRFRELRSLIAFRIRLKKQEHALRMRLRNNVFAQYFPELDRLYMRAGQPDELVLAIAEHCLDPREIARMEFESFLKLITRRKIRIEQETRLRAIWEAARNTVGCQVHEAARWEAKSLVAQLKALRETVKDHEQRMHAVARQFPEYHCLLSIPGFGPIVSAMVLAAIGNATRFGNQKQILRLAGFDLCASRSGKTSDSAKPVISKQGKAALRYALVQAAMVAAAKDQTVRGYFSNLLKGREFERGINLKMKVKLAAKMLVIAWTLMKRKEKFNPSCFMG
jgi:transposase